MAAATSIAKRCNWRSSAACPAPVPQAPRGTSHSMHAPGSLMTACRHIRQSASVRPKLRVVTRLPLKHLAIFVPVLDRLCDRSPHPCFARSTTIGCCAQHHLLPITISLCLDHPRRATPCPAAAHLMSLRRDEITSQSRSGSIAADVSSLLPACATTFRTTQRPTCRRAVAACIQPAALPGRS